MKRRKILCALLAGGMVLGSAGVPALGAEEIWAEESAAPESVSYAGEENADLESISYAGEGSADLESVSYAGEESVDLESISYAGEENADSESISYAGEESADLESVSYAGEESADSESASYAGTEAEYTAESDTENALPVESGEASDQAEDLTIESVETADLAEGVGLASSEADDSVYGGELALSYQDLCGAESPWDNAGLFSGYAEKLLYGDSGIVGYGIAAGERLIGLERAMYDALKEEIEETAAGETLSTIYEISDETLNGFVCLTAADLGVTSISAGGKLTEEAENALNARMYAAFERVMESLLADCPYELYWYGKDGEVSFSYGGLPDAERNCYMISEITWSFPVSSDYQDKNSGEPVYTVDSFAANAAAAAAKNADAIVKENSGKSDYEKLESYRDAICSLVSYDWEAAAMGEAVYGNSWQLISVFDGDPETNAVCEGYAKAFQYLCDKTDFQNEEIRCCSVSGKMAGGTGAGAHMWNIVTLEDSGNYLVDVTNCDSGTVGAPDLLFLAATPQGNLSSGYVFSLENGQPVSYYYDENQAELLGEEALILAEQSHGSDQAQFVWAGDYSFCTARIDCPDCGLSLEAGCQVTTETRAASCTEAGATVYIASAFGRTDQRTVELPALGHTPGEAAKENETGATWTEGASWEEVVRCSRCGEQLSRTKVVSGEPLTPSYQVTASTLLLKTGQKTKVLKVTGLLPEDQVVSWTSSNTAIAKVSGKADGTSTVTAGKKTGKTVITIRLASGAEITVTVKVQKKTVTTKRITLPSKKVTLKKGQKLKLAPILNPITSQEKIKYTSSNKKTAKVTAGGVITGVKPGKAKITVTSGKKKAVCQVTVTK